MPARSINAWYGWRPDKPDARDFHYTKVRRAAPLPPSVDLRPTMPPVYDQGQLGSCTANAITGALQCEQIKQKCRTQFTPSRLFIYYNERVMEGTVSEDAGAEIRDGIKSVNVLGAPPEKSWPYIESKFTKKPSATAYKTAKAHAALQYESVGQNDEIKDCLAAGYPVVFGFTCYESFEDDIVATTGQLNLPTGKEKVVGGHAVLLCGYDDASQRFIVRNSWGADWGLKGYFTMPYDYVLNNDLADDFWTIRLVKGR